MKNFKIAQPQTLEQITSFPEDTSARTAIMAGGTDLLDEIKNKIIAPDIIIDLNTVSNLSYIKEGKKEIRIGALTTIADLIKNETIKKRFPGLWEAALSIASPQLRNIGTVGGNLCQRPRCWYYRDPQVQCRKKGGSRCYAVQGRNKYHAILGGGMCQIVYPSDLAPSLISLNAEAIISTKKKDKTVSLADFYQLPRENIRGENILGSNEVIREIKVPMPKEGMKSTYFKVKERGTWDFAVVSTAISGKISNNTFQSVKILLGGVAPVPWRLKKAEDILNGKILTEETVKQAAKEALTEARPLAENAYKKDLVEAALFKAAQALIQGA